MPSANWIFKVLTADAAGQNVLTAQPWFPSAGAPAVESDATYILDGFLWTTRVAGNSSHTTSLAFGGTAVLGSIFYQASTKSGDTVASANSLDVIGSSIAATVVKAASVSATENIALQLKGVVRVTTAGTLIPQFKYSAAPGGAPTVKANTFFRLRPVGSAAVTSVGTWT